MKKCRPDTLSERTGTFGKNRMGTQMKIIKYNNAKDILVEFIEHGNVVHTTWQKFCEGNVKNEYDKSVCGVGYIGVGNFNVSENGKVTHQYSTWNSMLNRCYNSKVHQKQPTYKGCRIVDEWHNFQNFAAWYDDNYYEIDGDRMHLDKDILIKGNKIYSPETCIFVPQRINTLFTKANIIRGELPIGIYFHQNKYRVTCSTYNNKQKYIGSYDTLTEAFMAYKKFKEELIKSVAEKHQNLIPIKLYNALMNYEVEIFD